MRKFCIVIPVYKEHLETYERISLTRLWNMIGRSGYDVYLIHPKTIDIKEYLDIYKNLISLPISDSWFTSLATYSKLCMSYNFYDLFYNYKYMYIFQLDVYLFEDRLSHWCNMRYDYVGGPIFSKISGWKLENENGEYEPQVGNGGFSLRRISTFKELTDPNGSFRKNYDITDEKISKIYIEDKYFCNTLNKVYDLEVPSWIEALSFSWDQSLDFIWNNLKIRSLPMACHGFNKFPDFWKVHIPELSIFNQLSI